MNAKDDPNRIFLCPPYFPKEERALLMETLDTDWITTVGPNISAFEAEFCESLGVPQCYAAAVSSGTAALHLSLRLLEIGPGDDVICPNFTFIATANAAHYLGARPVFIDVERTSWNLDPDLLESYLSKAKKNGKIPKAIIAVHIYGQSAQIEKISEICSHYHVHLVEDAAEALGTYHHGKHVGIRGKFGVFSFNGNKMITTGGGGMLVSHDPKLIERARNLAFQGRSSEWDYIHEEVAYNYRMSNVLAAIGRGQLQTLSERLRKKTEINDKYRLLFKDYPEITLNPIPDHSKSSNWMNVVSVSRDRMKHRDRIGILKTLNEVGVHARAVWYPMHLQPCYRDNPSELNGVTEDIHSRSFCLPSGFTLTDDDQARVVQEFMRALGK